MHAPGPELNGRGLFAIMPGMSKKDLEEYAAALARDARQAGRALAMDPEEPQVLYNVACVYALQGQADKALDCLAETIAHGGWWRTCQNRNKLTDTNLI